MITQLSSNLIAVEIPIDATHINIDDGDLLCYFINKTDAEQVMELPEGEYEILGEYKKGEVVPYEISKEFEEYLDDNTIYSSYGAENYGKYFWTKEAKVIKELELKGCILTPENKFVILKNK